VSDHDAPAVVYLEADDEITSVVRRVRDAETDRIIVVAPGRSRATSSAVALRLLARAGEEAGREVAIVGDALTRSLAGEAGIAAYGTLDDARRAEPSPEPPTEARHAAIHVVRGSEETAEAPIAVPTAAAIAADEATRAVPVQPRPAMPRSTSRAGGSRRPALAAAAAVVIVALVVGFAGATVLPGATVTIEPTTQAVGPVAYVIDVAQPERVDGTVRAEATVTATGAYDIERPASGTVTLFNWTFFPVNVPAGTFVAAGEQAFATQADVTVQRGRLTIDGRILAGQADIAVEASVPGPTGNVEAGAIDVVVNPSVDAQLRGFPENPERRVENAEPTSGGADESGTEITQDDVDAAVQALTADLRGRVDDALSEHADAVVAQPEAADPRLDGLEDLVGTRDEPEATISGRLRWAAVVADPNEVIEAARQQLAEDASVVPSGHALLPESIDIEIGEASLAGDSMRVDVTARGESAAQFDGTEVAALVAGLSKEEAEAALAELGNATVELWPDWVTSVPTMGWRIEVRVAER
jgi:hypothetical protein